MTARSIFGALFAAFIFAACSGGNAPETHEDPAQDLVDRMTQSLDITYRVAANKNNEPCALANGAEYVGAVCYEGEITLSAKDDITSRDWAIFFSQVEPVAEVHSDEFELVHINGDLHRIQPTDAFRGFQPGEEKTVSFIVRGQVLTEAKLMPNYYVATKNAQAKIINNTKIKVDDETGLATKPHIKAITGADEHFKRSKNDLTPLATASYLFEQSKNVPRAPREIIDSAIIPRPSHVELNEAGKRLDLSGGIIVSLDGVDRKDVAAPLERLALFGISERTNGAQVWVSLQSDPSKLSGAYSLEIAADGVKIISVDPAGAAYGLYSLASLIMLGETSVPLLRAEDAPRFSFRGMHADVARNFQSKETILKLLDQMAAYKLNKLHLHLADDEGWRLEIPGLPELTDIGSRRCHDLEESTCLLPQLGSGPTGEAPVDGYFSIADYTEILDAASARHIQVIPSLDMPGHARAAVKSMEARQRKLQAQGIKDEEASRYLLTDPNDKTVYESIQYYKDNTMNPCMESSYAFVLKVITEVQNIHAKAGHPLTRYHIGADETAGAWKESPICAAFLADNEYGITSVDQLGPYFIERVAAILSERGIETAAWNDGLDHSAPAKMPSVVQSNAWSVLASAGPATTHDHANRGWEVVLSTPDVLYFDFPYEADPKEGGYYWAARRVNTRKVFEFMPENLPIHAEFWKDANEQPFEIDDRLKMNDDGTILSGPLNRNIRFTGIQGQIWTETVASQQVFENRVFPRLLALAERAWHRADWEVPYNYDGAVYNQTTNHFTDADRAARNADWGRFASVLAAKEFAKLDHANIAYRIPTVGARIENDIIEANSIFPGLAIEYRENGGNWRPVIDGTSKAIGDTIQVRAISPDRNRRGRSLQISQNSKQ